MRTINVTFEDKDHERLKKQKGRASWHDAIILWSKEQ